MKKNIFIVFIAILCIGIGIGLLLGANNRYIESKQITKKEARNYIEELTNIIINGKNRNELVELLGNGDMLLDTYIMTGDDMYLRESPDETIIENYNLEEYVTLGETLANNLEQKIKDNFEYEITGVLSYDDSIDVTVTFKTYYYTAYINDLTMLQDVLLANLDYDLDNLENQEQYLVDQYKAKIKAALLLNNYLDRYVNANESLNTAISFINKIIDDSDDEFLSYLISLNGYTYDNTGYIFLEEDAKTMFSNANMDLSLNI